jgi:hypothetical protein
MFAIGIFIVFFGWLMTLGLGVNINTNEHNSWSILFMMALSMALITSGIYIISYVAS